MTLSHRRLVGFAATAIALAACGGRVGAPSSSPSAVTVSPSPDPTITAYRHVLEQGYRLLLSDNEQFTSDCNFDTPPFTEPCRQYFLVDLPLGGQFVVLLSNAQVPAADATDDQLLREGLKVLAPHDAAAANAIGSGDGDAAASAVGKATTVFCINVAVVLTRLDPSIPKPPFPRQCFFT